MVWGGEMNVVPADQGEHRRAKVKCHLQIAVALVGLMLFGGAGRPAGLKVLATGRLPNQATGDR